MGFPCEGSISQIYLNLGYSPYEQSSLWVLFFLQISYRDNTLKVLLWSNFPLHILVSFKSSNCNI